MASPIRLLSSCEENHLTHLKSQLLETKKPAGFLQRAEQVRESS